MKSAILVCNILIFVTVPMSVISQADVTVNMTIKKTVQVTVVKQLNTCRIKSEYGNVLSVYFMVCTYLPITRAWT